MIRHIELKNKYGFTIRGYLNKVDDSKNIVIFLHGFNGNLTEQHMIFKKLSLALACKGISSLRMSYTGNGESDGEFKDFTFKIGLDDAKLMIDYICGLGFDHINLVGFSMGGMFASILCNYRTIERIVLISPAPSSKSFWDRMASNFSVLESGNYYASGIEITKDFASILDSINVASETSKCNSEVLIIQGDQDYVVGMEGANEYNTSFSTSKLEIIKGADHGYEKIAEQKELIEHTVVFLSK